MALSVGAHRLFERGERFLERSNHGDGEVDLKRLPALAVGLDFSLSKSEEKRLRRLHTIQGHA